MLFNRQPRIRNLCAALLLAPVFITPTQSVLAQTEIEAELSRDQMVALAHRALLEGQPRFALQLAEVLLDADPNDRQALIIIAAGAPQIGYHQDGIRAARMAFRLADNSVDKYEAARLAALAAAGQDRFTLAQYWLRRAANHAPNDQASAQNAQDYQHLRQANPFAVHLSFSLNPSNNLNGGSADEELSIDGRSYTGTLSGDARALSGWSARFGANLQYRLHQSETSVTRLTSRLSLRDVAMSDEARDIAPDVENFDFSSRYLEVGLSHARQVPFGVATTGLSVGRYFYGGEQQYSLVRFVGQVHVPAANDRTTYRIGTHFERQFSPDQNSVSADLRRWNLGLSHDLGFGTLRADLHRRDTFSDSGQTRGHSNRIELGYRHGSNIGPLKISGRLGQEWLDYPDYAVFQPVPGGRQDVRSYAGLDFVFPDISYFGFSPVVSVNGNWSESNVSRFDRSEISVGFNFQSSF